LGLALDESKEDDEHFETETYSFVMDSSLATRLGTYGSIVIDYMDSFFGKGFKVSLNGAPSC
jgi:Fe-S cluster assembly iron-binding protein IscA